ncbi:MAG: GNAT family N-acetyltransferase [Phycisphaerales bacterium]|nr:GNAT family N-acetyltransferase [Phycisphaerales bacterium]
MELQFRSQYWDDPAAQAEYIRFTRGIHGLDLSAWRDRGFWDEHYVPFSFFEGDRIVSNVSLYLLPMVIAGEPCVVPQVSGVGTEPLYRRRGLNRELTNRALAWCRGLTSEFSFLFADLDAFPFYKKCGFRCTPQHRFVTPVQSLSGDGSARRLNFNDGDDLALLHDLARQRTAVSDEIGCLSPNLLMFHALYTLSDCAYWVEELGVVAFAGMTGKTLRVFDIVGPQIPALDDVLSYLPAFKANQIECMFMPDKVALAHVRTLAGDDPDGTHIGGGDFPYEDRPFRFPFTAHA